MSKTAILKNKNLLVITPNFSTPIKDEVLSVRSNFSLVYVLIPQPLFPKSFLRVPRIREKYLWVSLAYPDTTKFYSFDIQFLHPKSLVLPFSFMRKRALEFFSKSSVQKIYYSNLKFDLIHVHRMDYGYIGARLKETYNVPLIITTHGSDVYDFPWRGKYEYSIARFVLRSANHIIAITHKEAELLLSLGCPANKISIIPNPVNVNIFRPISRSKSRSLLNLPLNKKIILTVGSLTEVKGHTYLIDAAYVISKTRQDIIFIIIGTGPLKNFLLSKIKKLGLSNKVLMIGEKPHEEIPLWLNASDLFVLPSVNEGLPSVILEAIACGRPVVATRVGGIPDVVSSSAIGILVEPRDRKALAQAILEALNRKWESEKIREYAQKYSLKNIVRQILQVYQQVLDS
jgi:glycosyltransferase involved in cell wall biosynthesis